MLGLFLEFNLLVVLVYMASLLPLHLGELKGVTDICRTAWRGRNGERKEWGEGGEGG